ncbi:hypothetical protein SAMN05518672_111143 [Chitinophaga sp. CF118]|uniref:hypothetical protein n=1 Tax=Chitinophaga sp. CF118 TaxID=1884367 RepID=UPI0008E57995|nr:hypothetical protein [Chitinophaga sp. CF118]SFE87961.1 hypothetical protein SAMN05518672_111143 [Chitinophaga sp. CF118]
MKKVLLALLVLITVQQARAQHAQTETLFSRKGQGKTKVGAYGAPATKFTSIDGNFGVLVGGYGGVLLNNKIMLGAGSWSLVNNIQMPTVNINGNKEYLSLWYTGFVAEYVHNTNKLIHWTAGTLIGGGGVSRREKYRFDDGDNHNSTHHDGSGFFVVEPFANLELNIIKNLRFDIGASYRLIRGSSTPGITDSKLSNPTIHAGLKAGIF